MRPYLAIIKDSFREALASRVLWVFSGLIVVVVLLLAPIGYRENLTGELLWGDIAEGPELVKRLERDFAADKPSPGRRIWSLLDTETRGKLQKLNKADGDEKGGRRDGGEFFSAMTALRKGLNKLIAQRDFYEEKDWQGVPLPKEARDLLARPRDTLSAADVARLNRLLIETPFQAQFASRPQQTLSLRYLWFEIVPLPLSKEQVDNIVKEWVLTTAMSWIVGVFGMIAAILVTAAVIPQMFEPGSITLLLSKPVSRSLLFSAKFLGACAFALLNVSLLIVGLWLVAGLRFDIWNHGMLACIPVFLFMFFVYYAVSALAGVIWKSAIVSVVLTIVFWVMCFLVDIAHAVLSGGFLEQYRINRIALAGEAVLAVREGARLQVWDPEAADWRSVGEPRGGGIPTIDGPFYLPESQLAVVGQGTRNPFGGRSQRVTLRVAGAADGWKFRDGPAVPAGTATILLTSDHTLLAITHDNIYRFVGDLASKGKSLSIWNFKLPLFGGGEFRPCLPDKGPAFVDPIAAAADPHEPRIAVCAGNDLTVFRQTADGSLTETARRTLDAPIYEGKALAIAGESLLVAREDGTVLLLSAADLSTRRELSLERQSQPRFVAADPEGSRFAVLFQNRYLWLIDAATGTANRAALPAQGELSGITWTTDRLLVADYANRAVAYDPQTLTRKETYRPKLSRGEFWYYYLIDPLYTIFPKPRLLNKTVQYLLTGKRTTDLGLFQGDLSQQREDLHPWQPVRSGLAFVGVMLLFACVYIERHEF